MAGDMSYQFSSAIILHQNNNCQGEYKVVLSSLYHNNKVHGVNYLRTIYIAVLVLR